MCNVHTAAFAALVLCLGAGCSTKEIAAATTASPGFSPPPGEVVATLTVTSAAFPPNGPIPSKYTCEGADTSPPLAWSDPPPATKSVAVVVDDPDAPDPAAPKHVFVHWVIY